MRKRGRPIAGNFSNGGLRGVTHGGDGGDVSPPKFELGGTQYTLSPPKDNKYYG